MKYEIEPVNFGRHLHHQSIIGTLTGLTLAEITAVTPNRRIWNVRDYLKAFHQLGFSTNPKFKKFDPETEYPCIMRCKRVSETNGYWYGWVYNDHKVYDTYGQVSTFEDWVQCYKNHYRVTSMLQVWI